MTKIVTENLEDAYQRCTLVTGNKTLFIINYYMPCFKKCCRGRYVLKTEKNQQTLNDHNDITTLD